MAFSPVITPGLSPVYYAADVRSTALTLNITSYTNPNGEVLTPDIFGMKLLLGAVVIQGQRGFVYHFAASGSNLKLTVSQDATPAAAAALPEIANAANHGNVTVLAFGR